MRASGLSMLTCHQIEEFIDSYLDETMSWRRRALFRSHLLMCRDCRSYIGAYKRTIELGKKAFEDPEGPAPDDLPEELVKAIIRARNDAEE